MKKTVRRNEKLMGVEVLFDSDLTAEQKDVVYNDLGLRWSRRYQHFWAKDPDGKVQKAIMKTFIGDLEDIEEAPVKTVKTKAPTASKTTAVAQKKSKKATTAKATTTKAPAKSTTKKTAVPDDLAEWKAKVLEEVTNILDTYIAARA